jgi:hypothetical protein
VAFKGTFDEASTILSDIEFPYLCRSKTPIPCFTKAKNCKVFVYLYKKLFLFVSFPFVLPSGQ